MKWLLWLDDQWDDPATPMRHTPPGFLPAASSKEALGLIQQHGMPAFMSLDHDLGGEDDAMVFLRALSLEHYEADLPTYQIHSANPVGAANIRSFLESWRKSQSL